MEQVVGHVKYKYTRDYFLGGIDKEMNLEYGAAGFDFWKRGDISDRFTIPLENLDLANKTVLDVGCGRGDCLLYALRRGAKYVCGVDFSSHALDLSAEFLQKYHTANNYNLLLFDTKDLSMSETFDIVLMFDIIEHIPPDEINISIFNVLQIMHKDSDLFITTHVFRDENDLDESDKIPSTQGMHCNKYTKDKICKLFKDHNLQVKADYSSDIEFRYLLNARQ